MSEEKGLRYNTGKTKWGLVHWKSIEPMVKVLEKGALKYAPFNWQKPMNKREVLESMMRHISALLDGEERDQETQELHAGHIMCNCMIWIYQNEHNKELPSIEEVLKNI